MKNGRPIYVSDLYRCSCDHFSRKIFVSTNSYSPYLSPIHTGVWNTPRDGFPGQPINPNYVSNDDDDSPTPEFTQIHATFKNTGNDPMYDKAELFYNEDTYWGPLGKDDAPLSVNTYETHKWNLKVDGKIVKTWQILNKDGTQQTFSV